MPPPFLRLTAFAPDRAPAAEVLCLPFDLRCKSRLMTRLVSGREALLVLPRGRIMRGGDQLLASDGTRVEVVAADAARGASIHAPAIRASAARAATARWRRSASCMAGAPGKGVRARAGMAGEARQR